MRRVLSMVGAVALAAGVAGSMQGTAAAAPQGVEVHVSDNGLTVSQRSVYAGSVTFSVDTTAQFGSSPTLILPMNGATIQEVLGDLTEEFSPNPNIAAQGTRDLVADARFFGLADVVPGTPATVSEPLAAGAYYVADLFSMPTAHPRVVPFQVLARGAAQAAAPAAAPSQAQVVMTPDDMFLGFGSFPASGSITVHNQGDTIHFMDLNPVVPGTTDAEIQAYFDSGSQDPPPFALDGPTVGLGVISPGQNAKLGYSLPPGTYALFCFVADDVTGIPHAIMGMHLVVTLS